MKRTLYILLLIGCSLSVNAQQDESAVKYAESITKEDLKDHLSILASDVLEGRETGERGQKMAAAFIEDHFTKLELEATVPFGNRKVYQQKFPLYRAVPGEILIQKRSLKFKNFTKIIYYGSHNSEGLQESELVLIGNASEAAMNEIEVKDKAVLLYPDSTGDWRTPYAALVEKGAKMALIVNKGTEEEFKALVGQLQGAFEKGSLAAKKPEQGEGSDIGVFFVSPNAATMLLGTAKEDVDKALEAERKGKINALKKIKPTVFSYQTEIKVDSVYTENVLGYLEGTDKKDELVVLTAHYDHIGVHDGEINNGADDDGSGTTAVMEIAEAFALAKADGKGPRRSMLFMTVTGEEKGLLGSAHYASNPVFPLANTIVDLNIDMIGRIDPEHEGNPDYVYLVGSDRLSTQLHEISEATNSTYTQLELDYKYNDEAHPDRIYYRSDHWNFAKNNVPIIFYFNGVHPDYHKPTDTIEKINFDVLKKRTDLVFHTAWELANREERITVDKKSE